MKNKRAVIVMALAILFGLAAVLLASMGAEPVVRRVEERRVRAL